MCIIMILKGGYCSFSMLFYNCFGVCQILQWTLGISIGVMYCMMIIPNLVVWILMLDKKCVHPPGVVETLLFVRFERLISIDPEILYLFCSKENKGRTKPYEQIIIYLNRMLMYFNNVSVFFNSSPLLCACLNTALSDSVVSF